MRSSADLETPVSAYLKVARGNYSFLLESVEGAERLARYSFIGTEPYRVMTYGEAAGERTRRPALLYRGGAERYKPVPRRPDCPSSTAAPWATWPTSAPGTTSDCRAGDDSPGLPRVGFPLLRHDPGLRPCEHKIMVVSHVRLDGDIELRPTARRNGRSTNSSRGFRQPLNGLPYSPMPGHRRTDHFVRQNATKEEFMAGS